MIQLTVDVSATSEGLKWPNVVSGAPCDGIRTVAHGLISTRPD